MNSSESAAEAKGVSDLPWRVLDQASREPPWDDLRRLADAVVADPPLWREVAARYPGPDDDGLNDAWLSVPGVLAWAGPRLEESVRREIAGFLLDRLDASDEWSDFEHEVLMQACQSLGPCVLPMVLERIDATSSDEPHWFYLWGAANLAAHTGDESLRESARTVSRRCIERALNGELGLHDCDITAGLLAALDDTSALPLLERLLAEMKRDDEERGSRFHFFADVEIAIEKLRGDETRWTPPQPPKPVEGWLEAEWRGVYKARERPPERKFVSPSTGTRLEPGPPKVGRNDPCPCGSGKKHKKCCLR